jgi:hypothetical protein
VLSVGDKTGISAYKEQNPSASQQNTVKYLPHLWGEVIHQLVLRWTYNQ